MNLQSRWQKLKLTTSNAGSVDLSNLCSNHKKRPTKRTPDAGDSAAISFYASAFFRPSVMLCERTPLENKNRETSITTCFPVYLFTCLLIPTTSPTRPPSCSRHRSRPARTSLSECPHRLRQESARVLRSRQQIIS